MAQNNPYVDDKIFHFGFQLGLNVTSFGVDTATTRVNSLVPGFRVAFVSDLRLSRHLNLRLCPGIEFNTTPLQALFPKRDSTYVSSMPITIPLYLKWSAEREGNYRPYVIGGGGIGINVNGYDSKKAIGLKRLDYFCQVGFGCDFYFEWFKLCPELTYRIGFANQFDENHHRDESMTPDIRTGGRLINHAICLTFNFE